MIIELFQDTPFLMTTHNYFHIIKISEEKNYYFTIVHHFSSSKYRHEEKSARCVAHDSSVYCGGTENIK